MNKRFKKAFGAYSLLEILATLAIVSIIIVMLTDVLIITLEISRKSYVRSIVREEQNDILTRIGKDLRNARFVGECQGENETASCQVGLDQIYYWKLCDRYEQTGSDLCKMDYGQETILEKTSDNINIDLLRFEEGLSDSMGRKSILVTLVVSYKDDEINISNQTRQIVVSTRNYEVK